MGALHTLKVVAFDVDGVLTDGCSKEEAKRRIHSQLSAAGKKALADVVIDNSGTPEETKTQVLFQWRRLQSRI